MERTNKNAWLSWPASWDKEVRRILAQLLGAVALALVGCTSIPLAPSLDYKSRAVTRVEGGVRVSTAVLSALESAEVYGVPLARRSIQPVWVEVENREDRAYYLLSPGLDPNFFPASEASETVASGASPNRRAELGRRFRKLAFHNPVLPGTTNSGFVFVVRMEDCAPLNTNDEVALKVPDVFSRGVWTSRATPSLVVIMGCWAMAGRARARKTRTISTSVFSFKMHFLSH